MSSERMASGVWLAALGAGVVLAGCGLELDYGPPDRVPMDGGAADASAFDGGTPSCESGCDDGLRCTLDSCVSGTCQHTDTCPGSTDCVARGGGECRLPCASADECNDGIDCTVDVCDPADGHCGHTSSCDPGRPVCLESGVCAPDHCSTDADCSDDDMCTGTERCVSGQCRGGTRVECDPGTGCMTQACDPQTGTCNPHLDDGSCADGFDCTTDICNPDASPDASGCVTTGGVACAAACGAGIACDPSTGLCDYSAACPVGQVCRADGCHAPGTCTGDAQCAGVLDPNGCATHCMAGTCQPLVCPAPPAGSCAAPSNDGTGCPADGRCYTAQPSLCNDGDPLSIDTCNPDTFACSHACPPASSSDCVTYTYTGGHCVPTFDSMVCSRLHPVGVGSCARYTCVGHDGSAGGGSDGCALQGSNFLCDDLAGCTDDTCVVDASSGTGTCDHRLRSDVATYCSDLVDCTIDACAPGSGLDSTGCTHMPDDGVCTDAAGSLECAVTHCAGLGVPRVDLGSGGALPTGCAVDYMPAHCNLLGGDICTLDGQCRVVSCGAGSITRCDDGNPCNGTETCNVPLSRCAQVAPLIMCTSTTTP